MINSIVKESSPESKVITREDFHNTMKDPKVFNRMVDDIIIHCGKMDRKTLVSEISKTTNRN